MVTCVRIVGGRCARESCALNNVSSNVNDNAKMACPRLIRALEQGLAGALTFYQHHISMDTATPTPEDLMNQTRTAVGQHSWPLEGGLVEIDAEDLWPLLEEAYDPFMPDWPARIGYDMSIGWFVL